MGSWSYEIMGGDGPLDVECDFEATFENRIPTMKESLAFILSQDHSELITAAGFILIRAGAPICGDARFQLLKAIDLEIACIDDWSDPLAREKALDDFKIVVENYPENGGLVALPPQKGLFETIMEDQYGT